MVMCKGWQQGIDKKVIQTGKFDVLAKIHQTKAKFNTGNVMTHLITTDQQ
jgi:hypothetical protein